MKQAKAAAAILGDEVWSELPFAGGTKPMAERQRRADPGKDLAAATGGHRAWTVIPLPENGGNVLLPYSTAKLSLRLPPTCDAEAARAAVKKALEENPPYDAEVTFDAPRGDNGWNAPALAPWLEASLNKASNAAFGKPVAYQGEGGSIPFMAMLGEKFPKTQFVVTGVLGPHSNAHGPNEFLHIPFAKKLSACDRRRAGRSRVASAMSFLDSAADPERAPRRSSCLPDRHLGAWARWRQPVHRAADSDLVCRR